MAGIVKEKESDDMKNRNNCMNQIMSAFNSNVQNTMSNMYISRQSCKRNINTE